MPRFPILWMGMKEKDIDHLVKLLLIVGAVNWGVIGAFNIDLIHTVFSTSPALVSLVYVVIGIAGLYSLYQITSTGKKK